MNKILVIIPCYNEEQNIAKVIFDLKVELPQIDILVVNDCSSDNSLEVIRNLGIVYIDLPYNLGYSGALQTGFKYALENEYEYVIQFDGDGQHIPSEAKKLLDIFFETQSDIVIGSRFLLNTGYKHGFLKRVGTGIFAVLIRVICKEHITDPTSGFQILNRKVFKSYARMGHYPEFPDANLIVEMLLSGHKIKEVPVKMRLREFGVSMHSGFWKPIIYMINMFYSIGMILLNFSYLTISGRARK